MKTLDDALKTPGEIPHGTYKLARDPYALVSDEGGYARLDGYYEPSELRRIADHLDPQANTVLVIPDGYALVPKNLLSAMVADAEISVSHVALDAGKADEMRRKLRSYLMPVAHVRSESAIRAEARREALEEAAMAAENVYVVIDKDEYGETRKHGSGMEAAAAIRALIGKDVA